ncbi:hypothetical protein JGU66_33910 [Myxococcaceae bacterium JPH2]|nr:hypothetical protein [Myxococcaceae bacterium JPH2]
MKPLASALSVLAFTLLLVKGFSSSAVISTAEAAAPPVGQTVLATAKTATKTVTQTAAPKTTQTAITKKVTQTKTVTKTGSAPKDE